MKRDISELVKKYEEALNSGKSIYLDADQFDDLAEYYDRNEDFDQASSVIEAGLRIHPENQTLLLKKARNLVFRENYDEAIVILNIVSGEYDFDSYLLKLESYLQLDMPSEAYKIVEDILANETDYLDNALAEIGFIYLDTDNIDTAILYLEKSYEYNPENSDVLNDLAYAYELEGRFMDSIAMNNKILDLDSYSHTAWFNMGRLYSMCEEYEKAIDAFDFALTIEENDNNIWKLKAHCLSLCNRNEEAIIILKKLIDSYPDDTSLYFLLSENYFALDIYDEALSYLNKYQEIEGETIEIISKKASIYIERGEYETAYKIIEPMFEENKDSLEANLIMGEIKYKEELFDEAEPFFEKAYEINIDDPQAIDRLVIINIKKQKYDIALQYCKKLIAIEPHSIVAKQRLILLYFELDNTHEFDELLESLSDIELASIFDLIYENQQEQDMDREMLIKVLKNARECRILFKNLKY